MRLPLVISRKSPTKFFIYIRGYSFYMVYSSLRTEIDNDPDWERGVWVAKDYYSPGHLMYDLHKEYFDNFDYYRKEIEKILIKEML